MSRTSIPGSVPALTLALGPCTTPEGRGESTDAERKRQFVREEEGLLPAPLINNSIVKTLATNVNKKSPIIRGKDAENRPNRPQRDFVKNYTNF
jgi:hypothetical protein